MNGSSSNVTWNRVGDFPLRLTTLLAVLRKILPAVLVLGLTAVHPGLAESAKGPVTVQIEPVRTGPIRDLLEFSGEIKPVVESIVTTDASGPLVEIKVENGDPVKADETLARIDPTRFEIALRQSKAALEKAKERERETRRDFERNKILLEKKVINDKAFDTSESAFETAKISVQQAQADLDLATLNLRRTTIRAPIAGHFVNRQMFLGQAVTPGLNLGRVVDLSHVFVETRIPESLVKGIRQHQPAALPDGARGQVAHIDLYADFSRSFLVKILCPNPDLIFKAGMFIKGHIVLRDFPEVPLVPLSAIIEREGTLAVFLAEEGKARRRTVQMVAREGNLAYVSGVTPGENLIVLGQQSLEDGTPILQGERSSNTSETTPATSTEAPGSERDRRQQ
jgi:membrane fusion protein, multidrug efflux system